MSAIELWNEIQKMKNEADDSDLGLKIYNLEFSKKFAIPFGAFFFALFALPFSIALREIYDLARVACVFVCIIHWKLLVHLQEITIRGKTDLNGALAMWLPNILLLFAGLVLYIVVFLSLCKQTNNSERQNV